MTSRLIVVLDFDDSDARRLEDPHQILDELLHEDLEPFEPGARFDNPNTGVGLGLFVSAEWLSNTPDEDLQEVADAIEQALYAFGHEDVEGEIDARGARMIPRVEIPWKGRTITAVIS